jgi:hypothetical protein
MRGSLSKPGVARFFLWPSQPEETIVNVPFGDQNSTNAKNGSPLTDAK